MTTTFLPIHAVPAVTAAFPDLGAIKTKQQATWASGDYAVIGVVAGNGNATLASASSLATGVAAAHPSSPLTR